MEAGTLIVRVELGTGSHRADQGCTAGLIVEMQRCRDPAKVEPTESLASVEQAGEEVWVWRQTC